MERIVEGIRILNEFTKPTLTPVQFSPVQALPQALTQASKFSDQGSSKMLPCRICSIVFSEVISMTISGIRKKSAVTMMKA